MAGISRAVCTYDADGDEVWKYAYPLGATQPTEDIRLRFKPGEDYSKAWTGLFQCARRRHAKIFPWPEANAIVVAASNAVYIVDPSQPDQFSGFAAPVEINDVTFDESAQHMFVAESLRIYAFSEDRSFRWISEPLDGYGARFAGCQAGILALEIKQSDGDGEYEFSSKIRLRTEDGTILRSRFRLARAHREKTVAA